MELSELPCGKQQAVHDAVRMFKNVTGREHLDDRRLSARVIAMFEQMAQAATIDGSTEHDERGLFIVTSISNCEAIVAAIAQGEFDAVH